MFRNDSAERIGRHKKQSRTIITNSNMRKNVYEEKVISRNASSRYTINPNSSSEGV
jgi:hypothetical protein